MMLLFFVIQLVAVCLILRWFIVCRNKKPFPKKAMAKFFILGTLAFLVCILIPIPLTRDTFLGMNPVLCGFLTAFLTAAIFEEGMKYIFFRVGFYVDDSIATWHDSILACTLVGMGFTIMEDLEFAVVNDSSLLRAILPLHLLTQAVMGYFYGRAKVTGRRMYHVLSLVVPVAIHTIFDMFPIGLMSIIDENLKTNNFDNLEANPYYSYLIPMTALSVIICIAAFIGIVIFLKKVGIWAKNDQKSETLKTSHIAA